MAKTVLKSLLLATFLTISLKADIVQNQQVYATSNVIKAFACDNNQSIPANYIKNAKAVAILTDVKRAGVIVSAQIGDGVFSMKDEYGNWSAPLFIKYKGFGVGLQAGYESSDVVVLFQTSKSFQDIFTGLDTLEANAGISLGSGSKIGNATDLPDVSAWMITPGKVTGIYFGATFDVGKLSVNDQATNDYYGRIYDYEDILNDSPKVTKYTKIFKKTLAEYLGDMRYYCDCKTYNENKSKK